MTEKIKEALAALVRLTTKTALGLGSGIENDAAIVRAALEAAQQEAEAWEAIEAWSKARHGSYDSGYSVAGRNFPACWRFELHTPGTNAMGRSSSGSLFGATRLEALTKAAAWCRAKLQRADQP